MRSEHAGPEAGAFDSIAAGYDAWYDTPLGRLVDRLEKSAVLGLVGDRTGGRALDLSCGTGNYGLALAGRRFRVVGVDVSEPMLRIARAKGARARLEVAWLLADARALPFRPDAFDLATIVLGLEFIAEPGRVVDEIHRILRPSGDLVVAILNRRGLWTLWRRLERLAVPSVWRAARFLRPGELGDLLRARGFAVTRWRRAVHFLPMWGVVGWLERWETIGARCLPASAAFVAVAARRL